MILNKKDYYLYRTADKIMGGNEHRSFFYKLKQHLYPDEIERFMYLLRISEYFKNTSSTILGRMLFYYYYFLYKRVSLKLGFSIPLNVFGPGLLIPHYGTIVVNANTTVGKCCVMHTCVCIAGNGYTEIGDFAYLSKGVTIFGELTIADSVTISANSFVNKSCSSKNVLLGGMPARILKKRDSWHIVDGDIYKKRIEKINLLLENALFV